MARRKRGDKPSRGAGAAAATGEATSSAERILEDFAGELELPAAAPEAATAAQRTAERRVDQAIGGLVRTLLNRREVSPEDLESLLRITTGKIVEAIGAEAVTIFFAEPDGIHFGHVAYSRSLYRGDPALEKKLRANADKLKRTVLPPGTGIVGRVIAENRSHMTRDASREKEHFAELERETGFPVRSMITVPIGHDGRVYGAIQVINKHPASGERFFSERDLALAEEVAHYSARALYMARNPGHVWPPEDVARYVARLARCEYMSLEEVELDPELLKLVGEQTLRKYRLVPVRKLGPRAVQVATDNPLDLHRRDGFQFATDLQIESMVVAPSTHIDQAIERVFRRVARGRAEELRREFLAQVRERQQRATGERVRLGGEAREDSAPVIKLVHRLIEDAYARRASDIHIEPFEDEVQVRYRIDGVLHEEMRLDPEAARPLTARLKIMARLDISEQRLPQDGRIRFREFVPEGPDIELRVATAPMIWGEKTVMRILDRQAGIVPLEQLGYSEHNFARYTRCLEAPYGMVLHCGPTGSGKTTSLYAALAYCNTPDLNIQTAEDPVEYTLKGVNQLQVHPKIGLTFARALRSYLRQDPDIILVGEIRDLETAQIAIEAALTGHQVFSTLHTNDAASTITRLVEMGVEPFLITGAVLGICAQRLVRRLCPRCRLVHEPSEAERELLGLEPGERAELFAANPDGCPHCNRTGYKGRMGVHEVLVLNEAVRAVAARRGASSSEIHEAAVREAGLVPLFEDAMEKVRQGHTDLAEALRNVRQA
ncbi:MAG: hypothetical protein KatS3mg102_1816 [Planctomycetota bacterium]|nr:MAG: hypothetical protein KatS3mg102_1816 [Planctomycetota bacterium]